MLSNPLPDITLNSFFVSVLIFIASFVILMAIWSLVIKTIYSILGKSKLYFIPQTLKELFLSIAFILLLLSLYVAVLFTDSTVLRGDLFKVWQILFIFSFINVIVKIVLTGLDVQYKKSKDRSGIYRSIGLLKGTAGLVLYFIALMVSINVLSSDIGNVVTIIGLFIIVLMFAAGFDQIKSILAGLQLGDYYIEYGRLIKIDGQIGFIEAIHGRSTVIRTIDGKLLIFPNYLFFNKNFQICSEDGNELSFIVEIKGKDAGSIKSRISGICSKIAISIKELPSEFKPKVYLSGVKSSNLLYFITLRLLPNSDVRVILDRFSSELSKEFAEKLICLRLENE